MYRAEERLFVNADRSKVVAEDSPEAAFLLVASGGEISEEEARRLGLLNREESEQHRSEPKAPSPDEKSIDPSPNKARKKGEDK